MKTFAILALLAVGCALGAGPRHVDWERLPAGLAAADRDAVREGLGRLRAGIGRLDRATPDQRAAAELFAKGIVWALRFETNLAAGDVALLKRSMNRGLQRAEALAADRTPWTVKKGRVLLGFVSAVDGSTQPYGLVVPRGYDGTKPMRLDVVLHGSSKPTGLSELRFGAAFDDGDEGGQAAPDADHIELHPLGRVENCYRWAGETDVFEAIEAVARNHRVDRDRIVLRGMSMGASGTWHLGLKHPDRFVALGPYCGYVDTHRFSETPIPGFVKVGPLPPHQELGLHMLDSVDYAANAGAVPVVAAIGDRDVFFQSHVHMGEAFAREGLAMVNLISPGTGHAIDPATHREQLRRIGEHAAKGLDHAPDRIRFVTWTLKYNRCHWLELLALGRHYERAEFDGAFGADGTLSIGTIANVARFAIHRPLAGVRIRGVEIPLPAAAAGDVLVFAGAGGVWRCEGSGGKGTPEGKRPGVQGPIDDAFATPFLCVRGTGKPWNPEINAWAAAGLRRFEHEWARYMRGDLPVKDDTEVTEADTRGKNLVLFGDPGSNPWIAKALPRLPVTWTRDQVCLGGIAASSGDHAPVFVCGSPFAADHYIVINGGHTFHEREFAAFNYLLFPRLGDWAVMRVKPGAERWQPTAAEFPEEVVRAGYFDEAWK
ncbi:MAG: prolyl oligopeptidase family serine peptidase [Verrucomicrobia bacterium]|nr:MAG: prolyl oligopeptidase family serine peptidase [Verrucomicrobiota bacterium]